MSILMDQSEFASIPDAKENGVQIECSNVNQFKRVDVRKRVYSSASSSWKACKNDRDDANGVRRELHHVGGTLEHQTASQASDHRTVTQDSVLSLD